MKNIKIYINKLKFFDTPTICNGMELIDPKYKLNYYTKKSFFCLSPKLKPMVGFAKTARIKSIKSKNMKLSDIRIPYYEYVNKDNFPKISVVEDLISNPIGSFWGEVNANIHYKLGCLGVLTNGSVRDLDVIPNKFQLLSGTLSPSHAEVHLIDFSKKINIHGMEVKDKDLIHADQHGAINIPVDKLKELISAIKHVSKKEKIILDSCKKKNFKFVDFKKAYLKAQKL
jgi:regulator of RNase E activity RraA